MTGRIAVGFDTRPREGSAPAPDASPGFARRVRFSGIRATVAERMRQHADLPFTSNPDRGEQRPPIVLNGVERSVLEDITINDVHVNCEGG